MAVIETAIGNDRVAITGTASAHGTTVPQQAVRVGAGDDRFGAPYQVGGVDHIECKVSARDTGGALVVFETFTQRTAVPTHLHHAQDEWFNVLEGEYTFRVGDETFHLRPGDSLLAPRQVPHAWSCVSPQPGKMIIVCQPAGTMESFFREIAAKIADEATAEEFQQVYRDHGMEIVGPPLPLE